MLAKVMNWVSRHILLAPFMCLFLLFACGSSHKAVKSDTEVIRKDSTSESVNIVHGSSTSLRELITTNGSYVIDFRVYDTRKPPDSLTGKPPLLADGHVEGDFSSAWFWTGKNRRRFTGMASFSGRSRNGCCSFCSCMRAYSRTALRYSVTDA